MPKPGDQTFGEVDFSDDPECLHCVILQTITEFKENQKPLLEGHEILAALVLVMDDIIKVLPEDWKNMAMDNLIKMLIEVGFPIINKGEIQ